jgi:hypothetical protein
VAQAVLNYQSRLYLPGSFVWIFCDLQEWPSQPFLNSKDKDIHGHNLLCIFSLIIFFNRLLFGCNKSTDVFLILLFLPPHWILLLFMVDYQQGLLAFQGYNHMIWL